MEGCLLTLRSGLLVQDNLDVGSVGKIVDCVISLKSYQEWKQGGGANGPLKYMKSPLAPRSASQVQSENVACGSSTSLKRPDLTETDGERQPSQTVGPNMEGLCCIFLGTHDTLYA